MSEFKRTPVEQRKVRVNHTVLHLIDPNVYNALEEKAALFIFVPIILVIGGILVALPALLFLAFVYFKLTGF